MTKFTSLDDLLISLKDAPNDARLPQHLGETDWTSLPTFGGEAPDDCDGVWSWDADRVLVGTCADDVKIIDRWNTDAIPETLFRDIDDGFQRIFIERQNNNVV